MQATASTFAGVAFSTGSWSGSTSATLAGDARRGLGGGGFGQRPSDGTANGAGRSGCLEGLGSLPLGRCRASREMIASGETCLVTARGARVGGATSAARGRIPLSVLGRGGASSLGWSSGRTIERMRGGRQGAWRAGSIIPPKNERRGVRGLTRPSSSVHTRRACAMPFDTSQCRCASIGHAKRPPEHISRHVRSADPWPRSVPGHGACP
jgi:hypothetical protein